MEFSYGEKVHRYDVTRSLFNQTPLMKEWNSASSTSNFETEKKRFAYCEVSQTRLNKFRLDEQIEEHLLKRYPTRDLMNDYVATDLKLIK